MTGYDFQRALTQLGLSQRQAAAFLHHDERTIRRYCGDELPVPDVIAMLLRTMLQFQIAPEDVPKG